MNSRTLFSLIIALASLLAVGAESQADVFVSQALGSDQNPGTKEQPVKGNRREIPTAVPINPAYLEAFLDTRYTEQIDFNADSPANQRREAMGLDKQGKIASAVTMFMNRYPWRDTLRLFGAMKAYGAQGFE